MQGTLLKIGAKYINLDHITFINVESEDRCKCTMRDGLEVVLTGNAAYALGAYLRKLAESGSAVDLMA